MNELLTALILAILQGITEWLPVSSSGHSVIAERMLAYEGGLLFEVAVHFGTLMAVFVYFGRDIVNIAEELLKGKWNSKNGRIGILLIISSIPAAILGFLLKEVFEIFFDNLFFVSIGFGITGLFLFIASLDLGKNKKELSAKGAFLVGVAQALAIMPGISRSGATISSGMIFGLDAKSSAKFSFLMAVPVIFGANILVIGNRTLPSEMIWATLTAFVVGLLAMHFMFKVILTSRKNLRWFGAYALLLSLCLMTYLLIK